MKRITMMTCATAVLCSTAALGQVQQPGAALRDNKLTITVTGEASGRPDTMVVKLTSEATAGTASDALEQCKTKADAGTKAIADLGIRNAEIAREMYRFSSPLAANVYGVGQPSASRAGTKVSQAIKVKVPISQGAKKDELAGIVSKVLDAANKQGVGFGQPSSLQAQMRGGDAAEPVEYVLKDATSLRAKALNDAIAKADAVRKHLAESGVKAGSLVGIHCGQPGSSDTMEYWIRLSGPGQSEEHESATSTSPEKVIVRRTLTVVYELPIR